MKAFIRRLIPMEVLSLYHLALAVIGAVRYGFPSRKLTVVGVTGTKGKTSTAEIMNAIFEAAGKKTALLGTLRFKVGDNSERNLLKMTMPGRMFVQSFLARALRSGCTHVVIEMTSEGARQHRHRGIDMDALIFTNLAPEHIESHGSYEAYRDAKLSIARALGKSKKPKRFMVANADDAEGGKFLAVPGVHPMPYRLADGEPMTADESGITLTFRGERLTSPLPGRFNAANILAAATTALALGIPPSAIARGVATVGRIEGRMERVLAGQVFPAIVDYAHTPDSLEAVYKTFPGRELVCVLGATGGGRDKWKRPVMGEIAEKYCDAIVLTNEDPYDEDPEEIIRAVKSGVTNKNAEVVVDRRAAIFRGAALAAARKNAVLVVTGKGTDPFIMGPHGAKEPWDDRAVVKEEIEKLLSK